MQFDANVTELVVQGGMMPLLLREKSHPSHERKSLLKVLKTKFSNEPIVLFQPHFAVLSDVNVGRGDGNCRDNPNFAVMDASSSPKKANTPIGFAPPFIDDDTIRAVERVLRSGWITTGPETAAFEQELATFCEADAAVCGGSWTGLAGVILDWFGVGPGDEVILPSYTYCATANVVLHRGATPILVDLPAPTGQDGFNLTWASILPHLSHRTKVIMPVDIGGWPTSIGDWKTELQDWVHHHGFQATNDVQAKLGRPLLLLDAAHSLGASIDGHRVGAQADLSVFSFHAVKNLTTAEGGAVTLSLPPTFDSLSVHRTLRMLCLHGQSKDAASKYNSAGRDAWRYDVVTPGYKCNMTDIQAAMGRVALARYAQDLQRRHELADRYDRAFSNWPSARIPLRRDARRQTSDHLYALRMPELSEHERDALIQELKMAAIATNVHFQPLPMLTAYAERGHRIEDHPESMAAYKCEVSLPLHLHLSFDDVDRVIKAVKSAYTRLIDQRTPGSETA